MSRLIISVALLLFIGHVASAQTAFPELVGIDSVGVYVKEFDQNVRAAGVDTFSVKNQVEAALRSRGIRVHPTWNAPGSPSHYVVAEIKVVARPALGILSYLMALSLHGPVRSLSSNRVVYVNIWNRSEIGISSIPEASTRIRQAVERLTDLFTNNWLESNPR